MESQSNGLALAAMVLGIVSFPLHLTCFLGVPAAILAVVFGFVGLSKSMRVGQGRGMAIAGLVLGAVNLVLVVLFVVLVIATS